MITEPRKALGLHYPVIPFFFNNLNYTMKTYYEPYCCFYFIYYKINIAEGFPDVNRVILGYIIHDTYYWARRKM